MMSCMSMAKHDTIAFTARYSPLKTSCCTVDETCANIRNTLTQENRMAVTRTDPNIPASDPRFIWTTGADVQQTWRRYGWAPPTETRPPVNEPKPQETQQ